MDKEQFEKELAQARVDALKQFGDEPLGARITTMVQFAASINLLTQEDTQKVVACFMRDGEMKKVMVEGMLYLLRKSYEE